MTPWVTRLILANIVVFILQMVRPLLTNAFAFIPVLVLQRPWTIVTYMFLHGGIWHLAFNLLGILFFGPRLEFHLGSRKFLVLYFLSGLTGAALSFVFNPQTAIIGASAGVFGVFFGFAYYWPRETIYVWGIFPIEARWLVVIMTVLAFLGGFGNVGGIAHFAHLGGFLGGFLYIRWIEGRSRTAQFQEKLVQGDLYKSDIDRWSRIKPEELHEVNRDEFFRIREKLKSSGVQSLTLDERAFLNRFSPD